MIGHGKALCNRLEAGTGASTGRLLCLAVRPCPGQMEDFEVGDKVWNN